MKNLKIIRFPNPKLREISKIVDVIDDEIISLVTEMKKLTISSNGIAMAAPQAGILKRIFVIVSTELSTIPSVFINPEILEKRGIVNSDEGCLCVPGIYEKVKRAEVVKVKALGLDGKEFTVELTGLASCCAQHEYDHLEGKLFVDLLQAFRRQKALDTLMKKAKNGK